MENLKHKRVGFIILLLIVAVGPLLDQFFHVSMFSRDPAPESTRLVANLIFFGIYLVAALMFIKGFYWARWITTLVYTFWFIVAIYVLYLEGRSTPLVSSDQDKIEYLMFFGEIIIRFIILRKLLISYKWIRELGQKKDK